MRQCVKLLEDARAANKSEWGKFSDDIKIKIYGFYEKVVAHNLKGSEIEERGEGLSKKVDDYKRKHEEFENKNMTDA